MAKGPFGNPLSTGIALNFEVDMTPYRQMHARKMKKLDDQKKEEKKKEQEFKNILKNLAYDDSKIHERMRGKAKTAYAGAINDMMGMRGTGDYGAMMQTAAALESELNYYRDVTRDFDAYGKQDRTKNYVDQGYIDAFNNVADISDAQLADRYQNIVNVDDKRGGLFSSKVRRLNDVDFVNKAIQGLPDRFRRDADGNVVKGEYNPQTGKYFFDMEKIADKEGFKNALAERYVMETGQEGIGHLSQIFGLSADDFEGTNKPQVYARQRIDQLLPSEKLEATEKIISQPTESSAGKGTRFEDKFKVDFIDYQRDFEQASGITDERIFGMQLNTIVDPKSRAKGGVAKRVTLSDGFRSIGGAAFKPTPKKGFSRKKMEAIVDGIYAKGKDNTIYLGYTYPDKRGDIEEVVFHIEPIIKPTFEDQGVIQFVRASGMSKGQFKAYYNQVAESAGMPLWKDGSDSGKPARRTEINESEIAEIARQKGYPEAEYRQLLLDNGIKIIP